MVDIPSRRVWDASTIIRYLAGSKDAKPDVPRIIDDAVGGETEIVVSAIAECEVAKLEGYDDATAERRIADFFNRPYILRATVDPFVSRETRRLVRERGLKPPDAIYLATAIRLQVPLLETYDSKLLGLDGEEGSPTVAIRKPQRPVELDMFSLSPP